MITSKKHNTTLVALLTLACAYFAPFAASAAAGVTINVSADSTQMTMGSQTNLHLEILKDGHKGTLLNVPKVDKSISGIDVVEVKTDSSDLGNNRWQVRYDIVLQPFEPGDITLEPFLVDVGDGKIVESDLVTIKVIPVELSPELGDINNVDSLTIHADEPVLSVKAKWYDFLPGTDLLKNPWFWGITGAILLIAIGIVLYILYKKNGKYLIPINKPQLPPYELAMQRFEALRNKRLAERGEDKQYYTELTDILRQYLEGRFGIYAMEMTSTQIVDALRDNEMTRMSADQVQKVLEIADFVKFAKVRPLPDDNIKSFNYAKAFVEETRPVEVDPNDAEANGDKNNDKSTTNTTPSNK